MEQANDEARMLAAFQTTSGLRGPYLAAALNDLSFRSAEQAAQVEPAPTPEAPQPWRETQSD